MNHVTLTIFLKTSFNFCYPNSDFFSYSPITSNCVSRAVKWHRKKFSFATFCLFFSHFRQNQNVIVHMQISDYAIDLQLLFKIILHIKLITNLMKRNKIQILVFNWAKTKNLAKFFSEKNGSLGVSGITIALSLSTATHYRTSCPPAGKSQKVYISSIWVWHDFE